MSRWVWGVDTSSYRMAVCALNEREARHELIEVDLGPLDRRLHTLALGLSDLDLPKPSAVLIEQPSGRFRSPAIGAAYGAAMVGLNENWLCEGVPFFYPTPAEWKAKTVGRGNATKDDVRRWALDNERGAWPTYAGDPDSQDSIDAFAIATWGMLELRYEAAA